MRNPIITVQLVRQVSCAPDRTQDRVYSKFVELPVVPAVGMRIEVGGRPLIVRQVRLVEGHRIPCVELEPDHESFRGADFANLCQKHEDMGFDQFEPPKPLRRRKKSS